MAGETVVAPANGRPPAIKSAVIVGGGLGGMLTAIALRKVGIDAQVYERSETRGDTAGTLISLFPNGMKALAAIDPEIADEVIKRGAVLTSQLFADKDGHVIARSEVDYVARHKMPMVCIRWSRLLDILQERLPPGSLHAGAAFSGQLTAGADGGGGVEAFFDGPGGEISAKGELLIGADGVRSQVRGLLLGAEDCGPRDNGRMSWRAVVPRDSVTYAEKAALQSVIVTSPGQIAVTSDPGEGQLYAAFFVTDERSGGDTCRRSGGPAEMKARLREYYKDWSLFLPLIESLDESTLLERRVLDLPRLPFWSKDRILLIGDAAHAVTPTLGQGANMTFEDALELARQLAAHDSLDDAIQEYLALRVPRVDAICGHNRDAAAQSYVKDGKFRGTVPEADLFKLMYDYERLDAPLVGGGVPV